jgi:hypothetical protein
MGSQAEPGNQSKNKKIVRARIRVSLRNPDSDLFDKDIIYKFTTNTD